MTDGQASGLSSDHSYRPLGQTIFI